MNNMIQRIRHKGTSRKGFTLPEMLIVIAIIAVLVAIAIPIFTSQMESAREAVDKANLRAAKSQAVTEYLLNNETDEKTYVITVDNKENMKAAVGDTGGMVGQSDKVDEEPLRVTVTGGAVTSTTWDSPLLGITAP